MPVNNVPANDHQGRRFYPLGRLLSPSRAAVMRSELPFQDRLQPERDVPFCFGRRCPEVEAE